MDRSSRPSETSAGGVSRAGGGKQMMKPTGNPPRNTGALPAYAPSLTHPYGLPITQRKHLCSCCRPASPTLASPYANFKGIPRSS